MPVINTNISATLTANALTKNERAMSQSMERLSTGLRINSAADDAAGLAIASKMTSQINGLNQAVRNANDAISMIQTADGAYIEIGNMLQRMRELEVQAANGTNSTTDVTNLDVEYTALGNAIDAIVTNTEWNGGNILDGTAAAAVFTIGANAENVTVAFGDGDAAGGALALATVAIATGTLTTIDNAIAAVNSQRATFGAAINRLEYTVDNLTNASQNQSASRSRIQDADYASETTELARTQIIQQAGTAMLSQANQQAQSVLALLK
jgi:flagellin